jgi:hypothetical protein
MSVSGAGTVVPVFPAPPSARGAPGGGDAVASLSRAVGRRPQRQAGWDCRSRPRSVSRVQCACPGTEELRPPPSRSRRHGLRDGGHHCCRAARLPGGGASVPARRPRRAPVN